MPHCVNCGKGQTKLNGGFLCKNCFANRVDTDFINVQDEANDCDETLNNAHSLMSQSEGNNEDFWLRMDKLLDSKLSVQEEKIKKAVLTEVNGKITDLTKRQKNLEDENKKISNENNSFSQRMNTLETRQKNIEQENQKMKSIINMQQGFIIQQDKLVRQKRLLISGLSESEPLTFNDKTATTDDEKVELIFDILKKSLSR